MHRRHVRAYIGLGANVGDARTTLTWAVHALATLPSHRVRAVSRLYATNPVGVTDQPDFVNAVVALDAPAGDQPTQGALALLAELKTLERDAGREARRRWGPRELDLDLLIFGRARIDVERTPETRSNDADADSDPSTASKRLEVPHREAAGRLFVLAPLADLAPRLVPPGWGVTVETMRQRQLVAEGDAAVRAIGVWDAPARTWRSDGQPR